MWCQSFLLFCAFGPAFHKRRGISLAQYDRIALSFEPRFQQVQLRTLSGAIRSFDDNQSSWHSHFRVTPTMLLAGRTYGNPEGIMSYGCRSADEDQIADIRDCYR